MTFQLIMRSFGRVLWFAVAGAICMALVGVVVGATSGSLIQARQDFSLRNISRNHFELEADWVFVAKLGAHLVLVIGAVAGAIAFAIAGFFACLSERPRAVFAAALRFTCRSVLIGVAIGVLLGALNGSLFTYSMREDILVPVGVDRIGHAGEDDIMLGSTLGVIAAFIIAIFYGAIVGAKREIARQKLAGLENL